MLELLYILPAGWGDRPVPPPLIPTHLCYRLGEGGILLGAGLSPALQGGAMAVTGSVPEGKPEALCQQILSECQRRNFTQIVADVEGESTGVAALFAATLDEQCHRAAIPLYLPESLASCSTHCRVLLSSAIRSGTLERALQTAAQQYGLERLALALEVVAEDTPLPVRGSGTPLGQSELEQLMTRLEPAVFFDRGLCAHYFTYTPRGGGAHFVLFDTTRSLREKLAVARKLGIPFVLLAAPQVEHCLGELFS